jgi:hypothetical protein
MNLETINGSIRIDGDRVICVSHRTAGSVLMMFGMAMGLIGIPIIAVSSIVAEGASGAGFACLACVVGPLWMLAVWHFAGGRFGTFVVDRASGQLMRDDGTVIAPLSAVKFSSVFDLTDGMNFWTGNNVWVTASCPGLTQKYRLGKTSSANASRILEVVRGFGAKA